MYEGQEVSTKEIGVDTARYLMIVDGQSDTIHTGALPPAAPVILFPQSDNHKRHEKSQSVLSVPNR